MKLLPEKTAHQVTEQNWRPAAYLILHQTQGRYSISGIAEKHIRMNSPVPLQSVRAQDPTLLKAGPTAIQRIPPGFFSRKTRAQVMELTAER